MTIGTIVITLVAFIVILGLLVLVHELGHFLTARLFKVRVEEFGIGFPPRVYPSRERVRRRRASGKTVYSLNALPLGGFVRLAGENGVASASDASNRPGLSLSGTYAADDDPGAFATKPAWQRAIILAAGAFNNMVLAMLLVFFMLEVIGTPHVDVEVTAVAQSSPAMAAGFQPGDIIHSIDGRVPQGATDVKTWIQARAGQRVELQIVRAGHVLDTSLVPRSHFACDQGAMGVDTSSLDPHSQPVPLSQAVGTALNIPITVIQGIASIPQGIIGGDGSAPPATCSYPTLYLTFGGHWVHGLQSEIDPYLPSTKSMVMVSDDPCIAIVGSGTGLTGLFGILRLVGCEANAIPAQGWIPLLSLVVELSASLAVINLLPIPALDGGRLLFVLIGVISRRRVPPEIEGLAHALGMVALLALMLVISGHDLSNWLGHRPIY